MMLQDVISPNENQEPSRIFPLDGEELAYTDTKYVFLPVILTLHIVSAHPRPSMTQGV